MCFVHTSYRFDDLNITQFGSGKDVKQTNIDILYSDLSMLPLLMVTQVRIHMKQFSSFTGDICGDNEASCLQLAKKGACDAYPTWMLLTCRKSCGNCGCDDVAANCSTLAKEEKCLHEDHVKWMLRNCQRSCKVCLGKKYNTNRTFLRYAFVFRTTLVRILTDTLTSCSVNES